MNCSVANMTRGSPTRFFIPLFLTSHPQYTLWVSHSSNLVFPSLLYVLIDFFLYFYTRDSVMETNAEPHAWFDVIKNMKKRNKNGLGFVLLECLNFHELDSRTSFFTPYLICYSEMLSFHSVSSFSNKRYFCHKCKWMVWFIGLEERYVFFVRVHLNHLLDTKYQRKF